MVAPPRRRSSAAAFLREEQGSIRSKVMARDARDAARVQSRTQARSCAAVRSSGSACPATERVQNFVADPWQPNSEGWRFLRDGGTHVREDLRPLFQEGQAPPPPLLSRRNEEVSDLRYRRRSARVSSAQREARRA